MCFIWSTYGISGNFPVSETGAKVGVGVGIREVNSQPNMWDN